MIMNTTLLQLSMTVILPLPLLLTAAAAPPPAIIITITAIITTITTTTTILSIGNKSTCAITCIILKINGDANAKSNDNYRNNMTAAILIVVQ